MEPPAETLDRCKIDETLPRDTLRLYVRLWTRLGGERRNGYDRNRQILYH